MFNTDPHTETFSDTFFSWYCNKTIFSPHKIFFSWYENFFFQFGTDATLGAFQFFATLSSVTKRFHLFKRELNMNVSAFSNPLIKITARLEKRAHVLNKGKRNNNEMMGTSIKWSGWCWHGHEANISRHVCFSCTTWRLLRTTCGWRFCEVAVQRATVRNRNVQGLQIFFFALRLWKQHETISRYLSHPTSLVQI